MHLDASQRGMVAARIATLPKGANQHVENSTPSQSDAAQQMNVSRQAKDTELIQYATEIKVRAERKCGELLTLAKQSGELADRGRPDEMSSAATLNDVGLTRDQSSRYQQLAAMPDEHFETAVATVPSPAGYSLERWPRLIRRQ